MNNDGYRLSVLPVCNRQGFVTTARVRKVLSVLTDERLTCRLQTGSTL